MESNQSKVVKFYDDEIPCLITEEGSVLVPVRTIALAIGLNPDKVVVSIKNDEILSQLLLLRHVVAADGKERMMQLLPIQYVHGWLFSIDVNKVNEEAKAKLQLYKRECYHVLYSHFFGKYRRMEDAINRQFRLVNRLHQLEAQRSHCDNEIKRIRKQLEELQQLNFNQLGLFESSFPAINIDEETL